MKYVLEDYPGLGCFDNRWSFGRGRWGIGGWRFFSGFYRRSFFPIFLIPRISSRSLLPYGERFLKYEHNSRFRVRIIDSWQYVLQFLLGAQDLKSSAIWHAPNSSHH